MDPVLEDPGWDDVVDREDGEGVWTQDVSNLRFAPHALSVADVDAFDALIEHAAALVAYPGITQAALFEHLAVIASVVEAATGGDEAASAALAREFARRGVDQRWLVLTNALMARRLSLMLSAPTSRADGCARFSQSRH